MENSREQMIANLREAVEKMRESLSLMEKELAFLEGDKTVFVDREFDLNLDEEPSHELETVQPEDLPDEIPEEPEEVATEHCAEEYDAPEDDESDDNLFGLFAGEYRSEQNEQVISAQQDPQLEPVSAPEPEIEPEMESELAQELEPEIEPEMVVEVESEPVFASEALQEQEPGNINELEATHLKPSLMDMMEDKLAWRVDIPGAPVHNILSAVSLNDRVLFINSLFNSDPIRFQETVAYFNSLELFDDAVAYVNEHFTNWDLESDTVYRFMMAVRRKLR